MRKYIKYMVILIIIVITFGGLFLLKYLQYKTSLAAFVTGTWVSVITNDEIEYTREYILNSDQTVTYNVFRSDGTFNSYDFGKYKVKNLRLRYLNPDYASGFGTKYAELEYSFSKDAIYEIIQPEARKAYKYERKVAALEVTEKANCHSELTLIYTDALERRYYTSCLEKIIYKYDISLPTLLNNGFKLEQLISLKRPSESFRDGGSKIFRFENFAILKCNALTTNENHQTMKNTDIIFGNKDFTMQENYCQ